MELFSIGRHLMRAAVAVSLVTLPASVAFAQSACRTPSDIYLNPFTKDSAHHRPIGTGARYAGDNHPATRDWLQRSTFALNVGERFGVKVASAPSNGPMRRVTGTGRSENLPANIHFPFGSFTYDGSARAGGGFFDNHATIYEQATGIAHDFWRYEWNAGNPRAAIRKSYPIRGLGHGTQRGQFLGATATGIPALFGLIRGYAINTPGHEIEHALHGIVPGRGNTQMLSREIILPATMRDNFAARPENNNGNIPYGGLIALPPNVDITALGLSEPGRRLARAMRNFGIRVIDDGGATALRMDQDVSAAVQGQLARDLPKIYPHLRLVLNGEWAPNQSSIGGGQPLAPNCAFDAGASAAIVASSPSGSSDNSSSQQSNNTSSGSTGGGNASSAPSPSSSASGSSGSSSSTASSMPQAGTAAGDRWERAKQFYAWAGWNKLAMENANPGSAAYNKAKTDYERNIGLYIQNAALAGVQVDANTPPDQAFGSGTAATTGGSSGAATSNTNSRQSNTPQAQTTTNGQNTASAAGNTPPQPGTAAANRWQRAQQFHEWAMWNKLAMENASLGSAAYNRAKIDYDRNIGLYIHNAALVGISVTADTPPSTAFN